LAPVKRDYMGLPRLDAFEISRIPLCKTPLKAWLKLVEDSVSPPAPDEDDEKLNYDTLIAKLASYTPAFTKL
jgi:hypothetical protein